MIRCRRNIRRSASVTRSPATAPRRASSASSSDTDAGAADDDDYELEERSAGTPMRRSATSSRAISPAAASSHASKQDDSYDSDSSGELRSALCQCLSDSNRGEQLATAPLRQTQASKPAARGNGHRLHATAKTSNCRLGSRTSQPESFGHRPSRWSSPNLQPRPPSLR